LRAWLMRRSLTPACPVTEAGGQSWAGASGVYGTRIGDFRFMAGPATDFKFGLGWKPEVPSRPQHLFLRPR
jgi:hypothetical protein